MNSYHFTNFQSEDDRVSKANELSLANVGGVFVVLLAGMGLACLIAVFEFIWKSRKLATEDNVRHNQLICKGFSHTSKQLFTIHKTDGINCKLHQPIEQKASQRNDILLPLNFADYNVSPSVVNYVLDL